MQVYLNHLCTASIDTHFDIVERDRCPKELLLREIKGLDNPTSQLLKIITNKGLKRYGGGRNDNEELCSRVVCDRGRRADWSGRECMTQKQEPR